MPARFVAVLATLVSPVAFAADAARQAYTPPPATTLSTGSVLQVILSLLLVLAAVLVVAWLLKRLSLPQQGAGRLLKVLSGVAVGQRERVVLVEIEDTWLVIGVAPGQVRTLHTLPKGYIPSEADQKAVNGDHTFQSWLKQMIEKRNAK